MSTIEFAGLRYDPSDGTLRRVEGEPLTLRPQVAALLETLLDRPGAVIDRETLCREIWGQDRVVDFEAGLAALVKELRQAFRNLDADSDLLETVPRRGYRLHAEPRTVAPDASFAAPGDGPGAEGRPTRRGRSRAVMVVRALLLVAIASAMVAVLVTRIADRSPNVADHESAPSLAVVPFETLGESGAADRNLDLVLADTLLSALWQAELEGVVLLGRTSIGAELTGRARAEFVARELGASLILEGSLIPASADDASEWRVEARLLRLPRGEVAWASTVSGPADEAIPVGELARALADDLARHWPEIRMDP